MATRQILPYCGIEFLKKSSQLRNMQLYLLHTRFQNSNYLCIRVRLEFDLHPDLHFYDNLRFLRYSFLRKHKKQPQK